MRRRIKRSAGAGEHHVDRLHVVHPISDIVVHLMTFKWVLTCAGSSTVSSMMLRRPMTATRSCDETNSPLQTPF